MGLGDQLGECRRIQQAQIQAEPGQRMYHLCGITDQCNALSVISGTALTVERKDLTGATLWRAEPGTQHGFQTSIEGLLRQLCQRPGVITGGGPDDCDGMGGSHRQGGHRTVRQEGLHGNMPMRLRSPGRTNHGMLLIVEAVCSDATGSAYRRVHTIGRHQ